MESCEGDESSISSCTYSDGSHRTALIPPVLAKLLPPGEPSSSLRHADIPVYQSFLLPNANFGLILKPGGEMESATATMIVKLFKDDAAIFDIPPVSSKEVL